MSIERRLKIHVKRKNFKVKQNLAQNAVFAILLAKVVSQQTIVFFWNFLKVYIRQDYESFTSEF